MSEPMTTGEIEDVLSSIRRLVTEDLRPPPRGAARAAATALEPDKLLLTPALRIVPPEDDAAAPQMALTDPQEDAPDEAHEGDAVVTAQGDRADAMPDEDGAAVPVAAEAGDGADVDVASFPGHASADPFTPALPENVVTTDVQPRGLPFGDLPPTTAGMAAAGFDDADAPDDVLPDPDPQPFALRPTPDPFADDDTDPEDTYLDADALRDLVREVLREELQGALGERITRNVRKLVRAEIARALAAQSLD